MKNIFSILVILTLGTTAQANETLFGGNQKLAVGENYQEAMTRDLRSTGSRSVPVTLAPKSLSDVDSDRNGSVSFAELLQSDSSSLSLFRGN